MNQPDLFTVQTPVTDWPGAWQHRTRPVDYLEACRVRNLYAHVGISARIRVVRSSTIKKG